MLPSPHLVFERLHALLLPFADFLANHFLIPDLVVDHIGQGACVPDRLEETIPRIGRCCSAGLDLLRNSRFRLVGYHS